MHGSNLGQWRMRDLLMQLQMLAVGLHLLLLARVMALPLLLPNDRRRSHRGRWPRRGEARKRQGVGGGGAGWPPRGMGGGLATTQPLGELGWPRKTLRKIRMRCARCRAPPPMAKHRMARHAEKARRQRPHWRCLCAAGALLGRNSDAHLNTRRNDPEPEEKDQKEKGEEVNVGRNAEEWEAQGRRGRSGRIWGE